MPKVFNVTGMCIPEEHYMVNIDGRLREIKKLVDAGKYFVMNRARQFGKTTTLMALEKYLRDDYFVVSLDFQMLGTGEFENENTFALSFARMFLRAVRISQAALSETCREILEEIDKNICEERTNFRLQRLFENLSGFCEAADWRIVLMIDEVDSVSDNQVFLDFLAQLRVYYAGRARQQTFYSVILAGVYDVKNLKQKIHPDKAGRMNSPWNIASDFKVDMSLPQDGIAGMLREYEADYHTGMDVELMAGLLYGYTSGYPFLVSRLCMLMDEEVCAKESLEAKRFAWTKEGFLEAVRMILSEKNSLFTSMIGKLTDHPELDWMLQELLFTGKNLVYDSDVTAIDTAAMFGFIRNRNGNIAIANRIFEMRLYNRYLSTAEIQRKELYKESLWDRNQFIAEGHLNMRRILEKFVEHFDDLYHDSEETFIEEVGRKYFLLYLRPIINGTGNYYVESRTRSLGRTDVIVDYRGERFVIEMKIWRGNEYHMRGEEQLIGYLDDYHLEKGYMISFNFNKKKEIGVREISIGNKRLIEAVV